jgi:hypothetical protein
MAELDDILNMLALTAERGLVIRLLNLYKGLPINQESRIIQMNMKTALVQVNKMQAACMELQHQTFIQVANPDLVATCRVLAVDFVGEQAELGGFDFANPEIGHRQTVRVQPADPLEVEFSSRGRSFRGFLADLSFIGAGMQTAAIFYSAGVFSIHMKASLSMRLPNYSGLLRMPVQLINVNPLKNHAFRLGMMVYPDAATKTVLAQYVSIRQAEIQREIRTMYDALFKLKTQGQ